MLQLAIVGCADNEVICFELIEVLGEHLTADIRDRPVELVVAKWLDREIGKDAGFPFCRELLQGCDNGASAEFCRAGILFGR